MKKIRISHRVCLVIDHTDPYTPAIVETSNGKYASSYDYACSTGAIDDQVQLTELEMHDLGKHEDEVSEAFEIARKDHPAYN